MQFAVKETDKLLKDHLAKIAENLDGNYSETEIFFKLYLIPFKSNNGSVVTINHVVVCSWTLVKFTFQFNSNPDNSTREYACRCTR